MAKTEQTQEKLLDSDDELFEYMFIDKIMLNSIVIGSSQHGGSKPVEERNHYKEREANHKEGLLCR